MKKVLVALSGGVDSSVAALLAQQAGYEVAGVTMLLWGGKRQGSSCSTADAGAAQAAANQLGIPLNVVDWTAEFHETVASKYRDEHFRGLTGNPCIDCNKSFKLEGLEKLRQEWGFDYVATGHYARVSSGGRLQRAADVDKDQSYVLATATSDTLSRMLFPLGDLNKAQVRELALKFNVPASGAKESMGLCLDRSELIGPVTLTLKRADGSVVGTTPRGGMVTVGQRRGLGLGGGAKTYVLDLDLGSREATVGPYEDLLRDHQAVTNWIGLDRREPEMFQVSAHGSALRGTLASAGDGSPAHITWEAPQRLVSPGQIVVGYRGLEVVGYGTAQRTPVRLPAAATSTS